MQNFTVEQIFPERFALNVDDRDVLIRSISLIGNHLPRPLTQVVDVEVWIDKVLSKGKLLASYNSEREVVGFAAFYDNDLSFRIAYLSVIACLNSVWGMSVGSMLMSELKSIAFASGMRRIQAKVIASNLRAVRFYAKNYFVILNHIEEEGKLLLECDISVASRWYAERGHG